MYVPKHFAEADDAKVRAMIEQNSFALVVSYPPDEAPYFNHLPVIFSSKEGEDEILIGHMARRNPQRLHFQKNPSCTIVVNGPHAYITPLWYKSGRDVPTWNYAAVHLTGRIELVENFAGQIDTLKQLTKVFEGDGPDAWEFELPSDLLDAESLTAAIVSFRFHIEKVDAKFKLSQNRPKEDRVGVIEGLAARKDDLSRTVMDLMLRHETQQG
ncbi:FMN-binding negative transcriptional regulator [soil metagenome]